MKKNSIKVCIRTRPTQYFAQDNLLIDTEHNTIQVKLNANEEQAVVGVLNNKTNSYKFSFDHVFHNASQTSVYDLHARDTVQGVVDGINGAIMSYGQTGSGKTFTMNGDVQNYEHRGIAPRAISQLFNEINSRIEFEFKISCTFMEIYNERIFDLLGDLSNPDQVTDYTVAEEKDGRGTFVRGLTEVEIKDENGALNLLYSGGLSRTIATHKLNKRSNRSHSIFTLYLQQRLRSGVSERVVHSKLHLIDLAGSERLKKTLDAVDVTAEDAVTRKESMAINQSLTYLEQCVVALSRRGQSHIPYRQSKLTNILKDCLGANCNTVMIACIWGESTHLEETVSTLRLASRMMRVQNETVSIETIDPSALIKKQEKIIRALKQELLMHDALVERTGVSYDPYTPEQQEGMSQMIERYVEASELEEENILIITSYRQMLEISRQFKKKLIAARMDAKIAQDQAFLGSTNPMSAMGGGRRTAGDGGGLGNSAVDFAADSKLAEGWNPKAPMVGEASRGGTKSFALGIATSDSRPPGGIEGSSRYESKGGGGGGRSPSKEVETFSPMGSPTSKNNGTYSPYRSVGGGGDDNNSVLFGGGNNFNQFESFAKSNGKELYNRFVDAKNELKEFREKSKELSLLVNESKSLIDRLQQEIEGRKASRIELLTRNGMRSMAKEEIVDEEEFKLSKDLKEAKRMYKTHYEGMQSTRQSVNAFQSEVNSLKVELANQFEKWLNTNGATEREFISTYSPDAMKTKLGLSVGNGPTMGAAGGKMNGTTFNSSLMNSGGMMMDDSSGDQLDDQEAFDKLEIERVLANDPDSLAFFQAQKTRRANITQNFSSLRQMQKNKRLL